MAITGTGPMTHQDDERKMGTTKIFRHRDYELQCSAKAADNGKFAPGLVVCKQVWPTRPREIAVPRGDFVTEDSAIDAAYAQGVEWIANYG
jgi:hypothetical protein